VFNSFSQWERFKPQVMAAREAGRTVHVGIRVNPEYAEVETDLYNPAGPFSRLGVTRREFREDLLDGVDGFGGSTSVTGIGYMLYDDEERRKDRAAVLLETWNIGKLRTEFGKWRHVLPLRLVFDVLPDDANRVSLDPDRDRPIVHYEGHGHYTQKAIDTVEADLERILAPLPIEEIRVSKQTVATEAHIIGTTAMGNDPETSIVDRDCVHHRLRNVIVLGSSTFPTGGPANPTLTIAAQALRSAERVVA